MSLVVLLVNKELLLVHLPTSQLLVLLHIIWELEDNVFYLQMEEILSQLLVLLPFAQPDTTYHHPMSVLNVLLQLLLHAQVLVFLLDSSLTEPLVLLALLHPLLLVTQPVLIKDSPLFQPLLTE